MQEILYLKVESRKGLTSLIVIERNFSFGNLTFTFLAIIIEMFFYYLSLDIFIEFKMMFYINNI